MTTLVILAGQSNALGFGLTLNTVPAHLTTPNPNAYIFNAGGSYWGALTPGVNTGTIANPQAWGPEAQFAYEFGLAHPGETLLIIKSVKGSTGLALDGAALDWSPNSHAELFDLTDATIDAAKAAFTSATGQAAPAISATLWMQGEEDATSATKAAQYEANFAAWATAVRNEWMDDVDGKIIAGRISDSAALPYNMDVRVAQWAVDQADADMATLKTIGLGYQADTIHLNASGEVSLGSSMYSLYDVWF